MFGLNGISTLEAPHSAIAKSVQRLNMKVINSQGEIAMPMISADTYGLSSQGPASWLSPECTTDVAQRNRCNLVVKLGRHCSDENAAKAKQRLDIHGLRQLFPISRDWKHLAAHPAHRSRDQRRDSDGIISMGAFDAIR